MRRDVRVEEAARALRGREHPAVVPRVLGEVEAPRLVERAHAEEVLAVAQRAPQREESLQLLLTTAMGATFMFVESAQQFALSSPGVLTTSYMLPFGFLIALHCYKGRHPLNMILLGQTLCSSNTKDTTSS